MTSNQLTLRQLKEQERHNRATETEERRHNVTTEGYTADHYIRSDEAALKQAWASQSQAETARGNMGINQINAETQRYGAETQRMVYNESVRHNQATESEAFRSNRVKEDENLRHNKATESISQQEANISAKRADIAQQEANVKKGYLVEDTAMNVVKALQMRSDIKRQDALAQSQIAYDAQRANSLMFADQMAVKEYELAKQKYLLDVNKLNLEQYKANLEGLKFKSQYWDDDKGGFFSNLWDNIINFMN